MHGKLYAAVRVSTSRVPRIFHDIAPSGFACACSRFACHVFSSLAKQCARTHTDLMWIAMAHILGVDIGRDAPNLAGNIS